MGERCSSNGNWGGISDAESEWEDVSRNVHTEMTETVIYRQRAKSRFRDVSVQIRNEAFVSDIDWFWETGLSKEIRVRQVFLAEDVRIQKNAK